jgi:hypothetical protein
MNQMKQSWWLYLNGLSRRCGSIRAEPTDILPRSTTTSRTNLGSPFDIFVGSPSSVGSQHAHPSIIFIWTLRHAPAPEKTGRGMTL